MRGRPRNNEYGQKPNWISHKINYYYEYGFGPMGLGTYKYYSEGDIVLFIPDTEPQKTFVNMNGAVKEFPTNNSI